MEGDIGVFRGLEYRLRVQRIALTSSSDLALEIAVELRFTGDLGGVRGEGIDGAEAVVDPQCLIPEVGAFDVPQEAIFRFGRADLREQEYPFGFRVAAPQKGREAIAGVVSDRFDQRASVRADLLPEGVRAGLIGDLLDTRTLVRRGKSRRVRS